MDISMTGYRVVSAWIDEKTYATKDLGDLAKNYARCCGKLEAVLFNLMQNETIGEEVTKIVLDNLKEV